MERDVGGQHRALREAADDDTLRWQAELCLECVDQTHHALPGLIESGRRVQVEPAAQDLSKERLEVDGPPGALSAAATREREEAVGEDEHGADAFPRERAEELRADVDKVVIVSAVAVRDDDGEGRRVTVADNVALQASDRGLAGVDRDDGGARRGLSVRGLFDAAQQVALSAGSGGGTSHRNSPSRCSRRMTRRGCQGWHATP